MTHPKALVRWLRQIELFQGMDTAALELISQNMTEYEYDADAIVFREGDVGDCLFLLLSGTMLVFVEREGKPVVYTTLQPGECFGEMALIEDTPRSATVKAEAPSRCVALTKQDFLDLIQRYPHLALGIMKSLCQRLRHGNARLQQYVRQSNP